MTTEKKQVTADRGAWVSIGAYLFLASLKLLSGYFFYSKALIADGLNNATDIVASIAVLIGLKVSKKPPDEDHPYGHSRAETIASLIASFIMATIGLEVLMNAIRVLREKDYASPNLNAAWIALFSAGVMIVVYLYNRSLANKTNSHALMAAAKDNVSDAFVSLGAFVGIIGSQFKLPWLDSLAAIVVGLVIMKTAWGIFIEASHMLSDGFVPENLEPYKESINRVNGVKSIKDIKARIYGNKVILDAIIEVDPYLTVVESHDITIIIDKKLRSEFNIIATHVHIEPEREKE